MNELDNKKTELELENSANLTKSEEEIDKNGTVSEQNVSIVDKSQNNDAIKSNKNEVIVAKQTVEQNEQMPQAKDNEAIAAEKTPSNDNLVSETEKKPKKEKKTKLQKWFNRMRRWHKYVIRLVFPYKKVGHTEIFDDRNYIIVGNHKSIMDVVPAAICVKQPVHFMAKKELWDKKLGRWFANKCECIQVNRDGADVRAMMMALKLLKSGETICIFPEGTRNKSDDIFLPFKSGAAALSIKTKTPILPIVQVKKIKPFKRAYFYYGEPFEFSQYYGKKITDDDIKVCDEKLRQVLLEMYLELEEKISKKSKQK